MSKIIIKGITLPGRIASPIDKYIESPPGPYHYELIRTYKTLDEFLKKDGQPIIPLKIQHMPFIQHGIITELSAVSCYILNQCLVVNEFKPHIDSVEHVIQAAASLKDEDKIDEIFNTLKNKAGLEWEKYWKDYEDKKIIDIPEQLLKYANQFIPSVSKT